MKLVAEAIVIGQALDLVDPLMLPDQRIVKRAKRDLGVGDLPQGDNGCLVVVPGNRGSRAGS